MDWTLTLLGWLNVDLGTFVGVALIAAGAFAWFRVPVVGKYAGLGLVVAGAWVLAEARGYSRAQDACHEAAVRAELAAVRADLANANRAAARAVALAQQLTDTERKNQELAYEIARQPAPPVCIFDRRAADRLRSIR